MIARFVSVALPLVALAGCYDTGQSRDTAELGMDGGNAMHEPSDAQVDVASADASEPDADIADGGAPELQVWLGLAQWPDGTGILICGGSETQEPAKQYRALLLLEVSADGALRAASLTIGEGASLPEVEDPDAYYPPDPPWTWHACPTWGVVPGFEYTAYEARLDEARLSASIRPAEVIKPWCELQPSYAASPPAAMQWAEYLCRPTDQYSDVFELNEAVPHSDDLSIFFAEELCFRTNAACTCDADSCTASRYGAMNLDLSVDGDIMTGRLESMELKLERHTTVLP
jgi:hypothetical protein